MTRVAERCTTSRLARCFRSRAGTTAVEFALLAIPFLLLVTGTMDATRLIWTNFSLQFAVEAAARCAAVNTMTCNSKTGVQSFASAAMTAPGAATFTYTAAATCSNGVISVNGTQVSGTMTFTFTVTGFPTSMVLNAQSCRPV